MDTAVGTTAIRNYVCFLLLRVCHRLVAPFHAILLTVFRFNPLALELDI